MLPFFRNPIVKKIMLGFIALAVFALVITGFGTGGGGIGGLGARADALASVEGETITATEVSDQVKRQLDAARQQQPELDIGRFLNGGVLEQIVAQLVSQKALVAFGREQGLAASKRMIDTEIAAVPGFRNLAGQFDEQTFRAVLQREGLTEDQLREELAASLVQRQLLLPVAGSPKVPQAMALQYASLLLEQRSGSVGLVPAAAMGAGREPTDAEVAAFFRENQTRYTIPERRVLRVAMIGPEQVAQAAQPTQAEIANHYRSNAARYGARETRTLSQVVLPDPGAARAFAAKLAAGTSFAQAAQQAGFSPADTTIGEQTKQQMTTLTSANVANAAFAAAQGATTPPLQSPLGWHIVRVDSINRVAARPLASVQAEIVQELGRQKLEQAMAALVARIEDALSDGATLDEVARAEKLQVQETPAVTATGVQFDDPNWRAPQLQPLMKTAFEMGEDEDPVVETLVPGQTYALLDIGRIVAAAPPPLAQIRPRVVADLVARRAAERARAVATAIVAKVNAGTPIAQAFSEAKLNLPAVEPVTARRIDIARPNQPVPPPLAMLFSLPQGKARILQAPNGRGWFVVFLGQRVPGNAANTPSLIEATRAQFERILGEEYAVQFARAVESRSDIERNEQSIRQLRQQLQRGGAVQ